MASRPKIDNFAVTGNLVADPRVIEREDGSYLVVLAVAENRRTFDNDTQQWVEADPVYYNVGLDSRDRSLGNLPSNVSASLHKGDMVTVQGNYQASPYQDKNGNLGINHRIWATDVAASMKFASVEVTPNPKPSRDFAADLDMAAEAERNFAPAQNQQQIPALTPEFGNTDSMGSPGMGM
ncbi:hypothetical protein E4U03_07750 [Rothia nasimurium]|uniref:Single-stranded DNA-binding protein n=1 Tax=Rothia nasimurium TaxID=85336 RepID=A0A4Y9F580_9MICC|nr:single-stranded DNA-binding protein [Rothia nasimurium]MBF0808501.1 single-stranded DNA-binding protein [Rothia nasimurium]TFU21895.1 hypothetical protein E4U03_07750 [Rothia nasimurium]